MNIGVVIKCYFCDAISRFRDIANFINVEDRKKKKK